MPTPSRPLRRDAAANRERLIDEAERLFAELGPDAPPYLVAERAGLGAGTLYRHFPTREDLIRAVFDRQASRVERVIDEVDRIDDPWRALVALIDGAVAALLASPSAPAVAVRMAEIDPDYGPGLSWHPVLIDVVARAHAQGSLRADVAAADIAHIPAQLATLVRLPPPVRDTVLARQRAIILDGLRAEPVREPIPGEPLPAEIIHALAQGRYRGDA